MFLDSIDDLKSSWGINPNIGLNYFLMDYIYLGTGLGFSDGTIKYDFGKYGTSTTSNMISDYHSKQVFHC